MIKLCSKCGQKSDTTCSICSKCTNKCVRERRKRNADWKVQYMQVIRQLNTNFNFKERKRRNRVNNKENIKKYYTVRNNSTEQKHKNYIHSSKARNLKWELSSEESKVLFLENCYYCNQKSIEFKKLNGIDRKDNELGYIKQNCVSCCKMCNITKGKIPEKKFIKIMKHITTYNNLGNFDLFPECFEDSKYNTYTKYTNNCNQTNKIMKLNKEQFIDLIKQPCYICGKKYKKGIHSNGLDRIDNSVKVYNLETCKPCCKTCNFIKHIFDYKKVLEKCKKVAYNHVTK